MIEKRQHFASGLALLRRRQRQPATPLLLTPCRLVAYFSAILSGAQDRGVRWAKGPVQATERLGVYSVLTAIVEPRGWLARTTLDSSTVILWPISAYIRTAKVHAMDDPQETDRKAVAAATAIAASRQVGLDTYVSLVNRCAESRLNQEISNSSPFHARVLIGKLFEIARKKVKIISGSLVDKTPEEIDVYGYANVIEQAQKFLRDPSSCLSVVIQSGSIDAGIKNRFLHGIITDPNRNGLVELFVAAPSALDVNIPHFMVADQAAYRFEPGAGAQPDNQTTTAVANFGDAGGAIELDSYFGNIVDYLQKNTKFQSRNFFPASAKQLFLPA
jgi:hypothetical protein